MWFWIAVAVDAGVAAVCLYYFAVGLADGSVTDHNLGLWLLILGGLAGVLGGGAWLHLHGQPEWALRLLLVVAIPAVLAAILLLLLVLSKPNWR